MDTQDYTTFSNISNIKNKINDNGAIYIAKNRMVHTSDSSYIFISSKIKFDWQIQRPHTAVYDSINETKKEIFH